ncbi:SCO family protein [Enterovirga aerilata]|uniref:SCO family protein n=1 Tax=Enterovirga aerilata TaxID=2730920 RepID=A0A849IDP3_9HYPH|nr:SCO family protein [Enterovirga sp. DB1703]NNM74335.1 SCO family protein [Enterovirga sp. DB1703]
MSPRARRLALPVLALVIGFVALGTAIYVTLLPRGGSTVSIGGPFALVAGDGKTVTDRDLRGAPYLVFFGFTHCPDVCPTKLFQLSEVFRAMGDRGRDVRALFITVDPERDTPEIMKSYVSSFDPRIIGLTGDPAAIDKVTRDFRAYAKKVPTKDGDYTMEHTSLVYLMGKDGRFIGAFNLERPPEEAAKDLLQRI